MRPQPHPNRMPQPHCRSKYSKKWDYLFAKFLSGFFVLMDEEFDEYVKENCKRSID
jgi:hypothetical protein